VFVGVVDMAGTETEDEVAEAGDEIAAGVDVDEDEEDTNLPPHTLLLEPAVPTPFFK
jgi:hypothetical protein